MLREVRAKREHRCGVCGAPIREPNPYVFAHVLSKHMYPKQRYNANNIIMVCSINHHAIVDKYASGIKYSLENLLKNNILITFKTLQELHGS